MTFISDSGHYRRSRSPSVFPTRSNWTNSFFFVRKCCYIFSIPRRKGNRRWDIIIKGKIFRRPIQAHGKAPELFTHRDTGGEGQEAGVDIADEGSNWAGKQSKESFE